MPPRYIAVPFLSGGILPIPLPNLTVTAVSGSQINASIGYSGPPGATSYAFEKSSAATGPFSPVASGTSPTFSDIGLPSSTTFFYRARVQVTDGRFSDYTNVKSASTLAAPPQPPTNLNATDIDFQSVQVTWNSPVGTILFSDDYNAAPVGDVALTSYWTTKGYSDFENSGTTSNVTVVPRISLPSALLSNPNFSTNPNKQVLKFTLAANEIQARLLWSNFPAGTRIASVSWWEYRDTGNLGGEKFCRVGNFVSGPGSNRGVDSIITLGQVTGTTLVANSANMHAYGDHSISPGISGVQGLHHYEAVYTLSNGISADGSVALYQDGVLVGQATGLQFFDTTTQAATGLQLWDTGGWSSTGGGTEGTVTYPITRYFCEIRVAPSRQGVWAMSSPANSLTYNVYRNSAQVVSGLSALTYTDTGLTGNTFYTYQATAVNSAGESPLSNSDSVITPTSPIQPAGSVKWNPGHYTESDTKLSTASTLSAIKSEIDLTAALANVKGYMILANWGFFQQSENVYTFTEMDNIVAYIKSKGKRWALQVVAGNFSYGSTTPTHASKDFVPTYINNGDTSRWGTAGTRAGGVTTVLSGESGWWGGDGNGHTYGAALWRPNVMNEWIKLHQAIGARYDSDPSFEMIYQGEDSFYQGTGSTNNSDYNDTTQLSNWKNWLQACCTSFPTTIVGFSETFLQFQNNSINLTNYITDTGKPFPNHPPTLAQTDAFGAQQKSGTTHSWGTKTYAGLLGSLGDKRGINRFVSEIQAPDQGFFIADGAPLVDVLNALNAMNCTHAFWAVVPSPIAPSGSPLHWAVTLSSVPSGLTGTLATPWILPSGKWDMVITGGGTMTTVKGSSSVTFSRTPGVASFSILYPITPFAWFSGGTTTSSTNGTSQSYTDAGLGAFINNPSNALLTTAYPSDFP